MDSHTVHNGSGSDTTCGDPGCPGAEITAGGVPTGHCLAHAGPAEQAAYLAALAPGADLDLRGTTLPPHLLEQVTARLTDPGTGRPLVGTARFDAATFTGAARFDGVVFTGEARFSSAVFASDAWFEGASFGADAAFGATAFGGDAGFSGAAFAGIAAFDSAAFAGTVWFDAVGFGADAAFGSAVFGRDAWFGAADFRGAARFGRAVFRRDARFDAAVFGGEARFGAATVGGDARFGAARFEQAPALGPLVCAGTLDLTAADFQAPVIVEAAARRVLCRRTRWARTAALRLRRAEADLTDAVVDNPLAVAGRPRPLTDASGADLDESVLAALPVRPRLTSLRGVDAAFLAVGDLDLTTCLFAGAVHLDQLRLEGDCRFGTTPPGVVRRGWRPARHTRRMALAEEHHWRAARPGAVPGWWSAGPREGEVVTPAALAAVYRALRTSYEAGGNAPGAADFTYGEMEMRRADPHTGRAERGLLTAYWVLSGYGLRAARTLGWLLLAATVTVLVMMLWGLPRQEGLDAPSRSTGTVAGGRITLTTGASGPVDPGGPLRARLTGERLDASVRVVVNSVVFRSSGQNLTAAGTYTEMAARLTEPVLLGLAALAVRGRLRH